MLTFINFEFGQMYADSPSIIRILTTDHKEDLKARIRNENYTMTYIKTIRSSDNKRH